MPRSGRCDAAAGTQKVSDGCAPELRGNFRGVSRLLRQRLGETTQVVGVALEQLH